jgi:hypothetical protein
MNQTVGKTTHNALGARAFGHGQGFEHNHNLADVDAKVNVDLDVDADHRHGTLVVSLLSENVNSADGISLEAVSY